MANIIIYSKDYCPYCTRAKELLLKKNQRYTEFNIGKHPELRTEMISKSRGRTTVPQIFINGQHIGGCDDLYALEDQGKLDELLKG
ncbi:glutaredoxin 3 [Legionella sp. km772]|uniref:glutaredoxin 3 n=1 Tax=Legionella sp. km772 TaxID=2498111 RepID=UPI000F8C509D|nr:glutaredoxin 3 [Legionella sp. km772]RUR09280.1 glutaredoxin 3 [Legionella sp. km772]